MLRLVLALLLLGRVSAGQSPFDGLWVNKMGQRLPEGPISYSLTEETFRCSCAIGDIEIKPDGYETAENASLYLPAAVPSGFRYLEKNCVISTVERMRLLTLRQPCPSSGNKTYSTGTPFS